MLIDTFLPTYEFSERHTIDVHASMQDTYAALRLFDMGDSSVVRWLYRLRGLPTKALSLDGMLKWGFVLLDEKPPCELVFGLVGRFWTTTAGIKSIEPKDFASFDQAGYAKVAANFSLTQLPNGIVRAETETRIHCVDDASRFRFRLYWTLIGPFSAWIRMEWLRLIKLKAESMARANAS